MRRAVGFLALPFALLLLGGTPDAAASAHLDGRLLRATRTGHRLVVEATPEGSRLRAVSLAPRLAAGAASRPRLPVLLLGDPDPRTLSRLGIRVRSRGNGVFTADVPPAAVASLGTIPGLRAARLAAPVFPRLDLALPETGVAGLRSRSGDTWTGATGEGVVVGLVDSGLDTAHEDFRHPDGSTRVLAHWAQADPGGTPPPGFGYGTLRSAAEIDGGAAVSPDEVGHGTHVAGIAAGDGSATGNGEAAYRYPGVAPRADLVVVATELDEAAILDGARFVFEEAARQGRPAVLNLSLGTQIGPHDGTSPLDRGIAGLLGPGRLAVASAGNEGNEAIHGEIQVPAGGLATAEFTVFDELGLFPFHVVWIDAFYEREDSLAVTVVTPGGRRLGPFLNGTTMPDSVTGEGTVYLDHAHYPEGVTTGIQITLSDYDPALGDGGLGQEQRPASGTWRIEMEDRGGDGGEVDLWLPVVFGHTARWKVGTHEAAEEVSSPATAPGVIAVGCYNNRPCWPSLPGGEACSSRPPEDTEPGRITWFSSRGPTRDGREKPDLVAPGLAVMSSLTSGTTAQSSAALGLPGTADPDGVHLVQAGTSQSAPQVSGVLALALQSRPTLTPGEAATALAATARTDAETGPAWNGAAGHGKLDAAAFLGVVPVPGGAFSALADGNGVVLEFAAGTADGIAGFLLEAARDPGWREVARLSGPGPHRYRHPSGTAGTRYRLQAEMRDGSRRIWAETVARGTPGASLGAAPNPFVAATRLRLAGPAGAGGVRLTVRDVTGRIRRSLHVPAGENAVSWHGRDDDGRRLAAGIYWVRREDGTGTPLPVVRLSAP